MDRKSQLSDKGRQKQREGSSSDANISFELHVKMFGQQNDQQDCKNETTSSGSDRQKGILGKSPYDQKRIERTASDASTQTSGSDMREGILGKNPYESQSEKLDAKLIFDKTEEPIFKNLEEIVNKIR